MAIDRPGQSSTARLEPLDSAHFVFLGLFNESSWWSSKIEGKIPSFCPTGAFVFIADCQKRANKCDKQTQSNNKLDNRHEIQLVSKYPNKVHSFQLKWIGAIHAKPSPSVAVTSWKKKCFLFLWQTWLSVARSQKDFIRKWIVPAKKNS